MLVRCYVSNLSTYVTSGNCIQLTKHTQNEGIVESTLTIDVSQSGRSKQRTGVILDLYYYNSNISLYVSLENCELYDMYSQSTDNSLVVFFVCWSIIQIPLIIIKCFSLSSVLNNTLVKIQLVLSHRYGDCLRLPLVFIERIRDITKIDSQRKVLDNRCDTVCSEDMGK